jgi:hypothetical protein
MRCRAGSENSSGIQGTQQASQDTLGCGHAPAAARQRRQVESDAVEDDGRGRRRDCRSQIEHHVVVRA